MIEILCIAAEITAVLLILSIAIPSSATQHATNKIGTKVGSGMDSIAMHDYEDSLVALRSLLYVQVSQRFGSNKPELGNSEACSEAIHRLRDHLAAIEPLQVSSSIDPITKLSSRQELEKLLEAFDQWSPLVEDPTWIGLLQMDNLDQLDDEHGPMASELILRDVANYLRDRIGGLGPLVRFNHCGFAVALHGWAQVSAIEFLESVRNEIQHLSAIVGESQIATTASASVAKLETTESLDAHWERLEDGIVEAIAKGGNRGRWFDDSDRIWRAMGAEIDLESTDDSNHDSNESTDPENANAVNTDVDMQNKSVPTDPLPSLEPTGATDALEIAATSSGDLANDALAADDIATLFKAAKTDHLNKKAAPPEPTPTRSIEAVAPQLEETSGETAIEDDIAALFKAARAFKGPSIANNDEPDSAKPVKTLKKDTTIEETPAATNDDIESLFAAFKKTK